MSRGLLAQPVTALTGVGEALATKLARLRLSLIHI